MKKIYCDCCEREIPYSRDIRYARMERLNATEDERVPALVEREICTHCFLAIKEFIEKLGRRGKMQPKVSYVLVTCRNAWLYEAVESVKNQTLQDWELIIIDTASRNLPFSFANLGIKKDKRIRYYEADIMPLQGYNLGRMIARSDIILHLSDDDMDLPNRAQVCYDGITRDGADIFVASYIRVEMDGSFRSEQFTEPFDYATHKLCANDVPIMAAGYRKSTTPIFHDDIHFLTDIAWFLESHNIGLKIITSHTHVCKVREHPDRICAGGRASDMARRAERNRLAIMFNDPEMREPSWAILEKRIKEQVKKERL